MKILIADDDPMALRFLQRSLQMWGHDVSTAPDGEEALRIARENGGFQVLFLDWRMPGLSGPEVCREIRRASASSGYQYIFIVTARDTREDYVEGMEAGADDFFVKPFDPEELRLRLRAAQRVIELEEALAQHYQELQQTNDRIRHDLRMAAEVQQGFLPDSPPSIHGYQFAWRFSPCDYVAGDSFNVFRLDECCWGFYILDVSGHGIPSALFSVSLSRVLAPTPEAGGLLKLATSSPPFYEVLSPSQVAAILNERFPQDMRTGMYFTLLYGILHSRNGVVKWVCAGHQPPLRLEAATRSAHYLTQPSGPPIGLMPARKIEWEMGEIALAPGDRLVLFSDGLVDTFDAKGAAYGQDNLARKLETHFDDPLDHALDAAIDSARKWAGTDTFSDDVTLLALERSP